MKKRAQKFIISFVAIISLIACTSLTSSLQAADLNSYHEDQLNLHAKSALAIDSKTGQLLYAKNANQKLPIASMTKLITVYLTLKAIKQKQISWQTKVKPTAAIVKVANNTAYSNVPLKKGHSYTVKQLYQATLIESANGAAMCLAQKVAGSQRAFVLRMRKQLCNWGIHDAKVYTVNGLPNGNLGKDAYPGVSKKAENKLSAKEMAIVGQKLINNYPFVLRTTRIAHLAFKDKGKVTQMANFNWMLKGLSQYNPALKVDGLKTGTTDAAGACFIGTIKKNKGRLITVVMGARHRNASDPARFIETKKLMNFVFSHYSPVFLKAGSNFKQAENIKVTDGQEAETPVGLKRGMTIWDPLDGKQLAARLSKNAVNAPLKKGQTVAAYKLRSGQNNLVCLSKGMQAPVKAMEANSEVNFFVKIWRFITGTR